ncbi:minor pilin subunit PapF [Escherichia coli P0299438.10]|nr:minor pilin subunit PapF [Escherichia coli 2726800]ENA20457.1 minor pilin subunit PapF [Escherichia coli 201600.1]ENB84381.1 minor pilin subunit PapF [Escherichia coli P0299438.10]
MTTGLDTASSTFSFTSVPFRNGSGVLNSGEFQATANMSIIYN